MQLILRIHRHVFQIGNDLLHMMKHSLVISVDFFLLANQSMYLRFNLIFSIYKNSNTVLLFNLDSNEVEQDRTN